MTIEQGTISGRSDALRLVFDRVVAHSPRLRAERPDGLIMSVVVRNAGAGKPESASLQVEVSGTAAAMVGPRIGQWVTECVEHRARSHPNDGQKVQRLRAEQPLQLDSRHVVS